MIELTNALAMAYDMPPEAEGLDELYRDAILHVLLDSDGWTTDGMLHLTRELVNEYFQKSEYIRR